MKLLPASSLVVAAAIAVAAPAVADPDLSALPVDPNVITDSAAYNGQPPLLDPNGQPGVQQTFTHRDGSRQIIDTVLTLPDPEAAVAALEADRSTAAASMIDQSSTTVPVGRNGVILTGMSSDRTHAVAVLLFTQGATATNIEFRATPNDPAPTDLIVDYGQRQDDAIQQQFAP